ncbi:MAG: peptide deformylase [Firmicutes bacterium]|nr:peptide deformylase [Bacillota bacterium]
MAIREIVLDTDPQLREKCIEVKRFSPTLHQLLDDMKETMEAANGAGLAAPQVGINKRIFVADGGEGYIEMINPRITKKSGEDIDLEGCLSVPDRQGYVRRALKITIEAQDRFGNAFTMETEGWQARIFQHEYEHLDGRLYTDIMLKEVFFEDEEEEE